jgi:hypothetical protein
LHRVCFEKWRGVVYGKIFLLITKTPNACKIQVVTKLTIMDAKCGDIALE